MAPRHPDKTRENKARRALERQGFQLSKSRVRDPRAIGFGDYYVQTSRGRKVATLASLDEVEAWIVADSETRGRSLRIVTKEG